MRYRLVSDRTVNRLIPHYLSGRRFVLFVQSLVHPLQRCNERFVELAKEKLIEANMTSQILYFEWFLNRKLGQYLSDNKDRIYIKDSTIIGVDLYHEDSLNAKPYTLWFEGEQLGTINPSEVSKEFYHSSEEKAINRVSFMVCVPAIQIPEAEFVYMLSYWVNTYKLAGKTYLIKIDNKEITPITK